MNNNTLRGLTADQRKEFIRRASFISEADRDTRAAFVDEIVRAALASAPVAAQQSEPSAEPWKLLWEDIMAVAESTGTPTPTMMKEWAWRLRRCAESAPVADEPVPYPKRDDVTPEMRASFERLFSEARRHNHGTLARNEQGAYRDLRVDADWVFYQRAWADALASAPVADGEWPTLSDLHLQALMFAYNEGYSKAIDGRKFKNPFETSGSQAAAWELGTQDGTEARSKMASAPVAAEHLDGLRTLLAQLPGMREDPRKGDAVFRCGVNGALDVVEGRIRELLRSAPVAGEAQKPVAVVADDFALHWAGTGPIGPIVKRHGLKVGSRLYAEPQVQGKLVAVLNVVENGYGRTVDVEMLEAGNQLPTGRWVVRLAKPGEWGEG